MEIKKKNVLNPLILFILASFIMGGCSMKSGMTSSFEMGAAFIEKPSMELVLDRMNTAAAAARLSDKILNTIEITETTDWPQRIVGFSKEDLQPVTQALLLDGAYAAHGGILSPIKANVVQVQDILYTIPPDLYSQSGSCYRNGEKTLINGFYYHVKNASTIEKKSLLELPAGEIAAVVASSAKSIFINKKCNPEEALIKREGLLKPILIAEDATSTDSYAGVILAFVNTIENGDEANNLSGSYQDLNDLKEEIIDKSKRLSELEKAKDTILNGKTPVGYNLPSTEEGCDKEITDIRMSLEKGTESEEGLKSRLKSAKDIFGKALKDVDVSACTGTDKGQKEMLINIIDACTGMQEMLTGALNLTGIAIAKLPNSVIGLPDEFKSLINSVKDKEVKAVYIPLRLARLRFNAGNVIDNIKGIATVIKLDLFIANKIKSKSKELLKRMEVPDAEG